MRTVIQIIKTDPGASTPEYLVVLQLYRYGASFPYQSTTLYSGHDADAAFMAADAAQKREFGLDS